MLAHTPTLIGQSVYVSKTRRVATRAVITFALLAVSACTGSAEATPPTAKQLARQLIESDICYGSPRVTDAARTHAECANDSDSGIRIHAFADRKSLRSDIDRRLAAYCRELPEDETYRWFHYRVGRYWWMRMAGALPYEESIRRSIGGELRTRTCR